MALLTIQEAARRLGTDEKTVQEWIERGLLRPKYSCLPTAAGSKRYPASRTLQFIMPEICVDEDELEEAAEAYGWFLMSAKALTNEESNPST